jgi:hypothetical protein
LPLRKTFKDVASALESFSHLLKETEHFRRWHQEKVAKIVQCGSRANLHQALSDYALEHAGTIADLDPALEDAATNHLLQQNSGQ